MAPIAVAHNPWERWTDFAQLEATCWGGLNRVRVWDVPARLVLHEKLGARVGATWKTPMGLARVIEIGEPYVLTIDGRVSRRQSVLVQVLGPPRAPVTALQAAAMRARFRTQRAQKRTQQMQNRVH